MKKVNGKTVKQGVAEGTGVTDYNPKSQGGTRKELLAKYHKTKNPKDAEAARKAGATQKELQGVSEQTLSEKAVSKAQQKFMGMVHATKKGEKPASKEVAKAAKSMSAKAAKDYASTKHKGLPDKVEEGLDSQMESWNRELNALLNEGLTVTTSTGQPGGSDSVSISATDEDAKLLMRMVQDAGLMRGQSQAMSMPASDHSHDTVEPVSHDEVMGTLEPAGEEGEGDLSFIKRMLGARADHSGSTSGDYEQEDGHGVCGECGHEDCKCDDHMAMEEEEQNPNGSGTDNTPKKGGGLLKTGSMPPHLEKAMSTLPQAKVDEEQVDEKRQRNFNPHDELSGRGRISPFNKTAAGKKAEFDRGTEELKDKIKFTRDQGGVAGPKGHLPEEVEVDEELHGRQTELDKDDDGDIDEKDLAMLRAGKDKKVKEEALDQPATMEGEGERCDECGAMMEEDHQCKEDALEGLNEWANTRGGSSRDEAFIADMAFMTKAISGGLNNMKQDQTVVPSARVKTGAEVRDPEVSMAELLRKLANIN